MSFKSLDAIRRRSTPIEVDLIESYAQRRINRRDFIKRGVVIGLGIPTMSAVIAACGGDDTDSSSTTAADPASGGEPVQGGNLIVANIVGDSASGLDPVNMLDFGTYNVLAQSFEPLVGVADDGGIGPTALATSWTPNDDGSVWTFDLREGVTWQNGGDFTSADVAATMDRLVAQGNAGLAGVIAEGAVDASDPLKAVFTLEQPNGNFPFLVSMFNAQALITPADYSDGTTLNERPDGTGAWTLESFDPSTFVAKFVRNPDWWGGQTPLDAIELRGFEELGTAMTAMASRDIDAIQQLQVIGGEGLLDDPDFVLLTPPSASHSQIWFNTQQGNEFVDRLVRQALAYTIDREQMINSLFNGRAELGNDHPILASLPFYDPEAVPQRSRDIEMAKSLLAEAGVDSVTSAIDLADIQEHPDMATIMQQNAAEAGFDLSVRSQSNSTFYGAAWCPGPSDSDDTLPCDNSTPLGIVAWGHRPVPDIYLGSALTTGAVWNASNYANSAYDDVFSQYQRSVTVDEQKSAIGDIMRILHEETPACYPFFSNYLSGHDKGVVGMQATALGQSILSGAAKTE